MASTPQNLALGDVNGDTFPDIVTANFGSSSVGVLLGHADGTFSAATTYPTGKGNTTPQGVALGDVNGDGQVDVITANTGTNEVGVLINQGKGVFTKSVTYSSDLKTKSGLIGVTLGYVNKDNLLDIVTANSNSNTVGVLLNQGGGIFAPVVTYATDMLSVNGNPYNVALGDVNGDKALDIVTVNAATNNAGVLLGIGDGTFKPVATYGVMAGDVPQGVAIGDVNGDTFLDLVLANNGSNSAGVLLGLGDGTFGSVMPYSTGVNSAPNNLALADINKDGYLDILTANSSGTVGVLLGMKGGGFSPVNTYDAGPSSAPNGVVVGDVNGDSYPDAITANNGSSTAGVLLNVKMLYPDLVVSTTMSIPGGIYNNITVTGNGNGTLGADVTVNTAIIVQDGGTLSDGCHLITGVGTFTLAAGGTLVICRPRGILAVGDPQGNLGTVRVTGERSFSTDASYVYTGSDVTGSGLPSQVRNLSIISTNNVGLTQSTSVAQVLTLSNTGNLTLGGQTLTLLSSAAGTALVVNSGAGIVNGNTTVQRYIDPTLNAGLGYRHYSAPVSNAMVSTLTTPGYTPVVNPAYNTSPNPSSVVPFPTSFEYDETYVKTSGNPGSQDFDTGFRSSPSLTDGLAPGQGYAENIAASETVVFNGPLNNGDVPMTGLTRGTQTNSGWWLLGNPYPAPLDYSLVALADRPNLNGAVYVFSSTAQYAGMYRAYLPPVDGQPGIGNPVLPVAQGFFVRVSAGQPSGSLTFHNSQRKTVSDATTFQRPTADTRPLVQLELRGTTGPADALYAYAQAGATPAFDSQFDAEKLPNPSGLNLSSTATSGQRLAIDGRPVFDAATVLPLSVGVPAAGAYTFSAVTLNNLAAGLGAFLVDAQTGQTVNLRTQPTYSFTVTAAQATALLVGRFSVHFAAGVLATAPALTAAQVELYPNPAHARFAVLMPGVTGATAVQAELVNTLGQVVRHQSAALPASGATLTVETGELAAGVYTLRLLAGPTTLAKRVVIQ